MAATDAKPFPQRNVAYRVTFPILDADGDPVPAATGLDSEVSKDGGTFTDCGSEATEIAAASGVYYLDLTAGEMDADTVAITVKTTSSGAKTTIIVMYPEEAGDIRVNATAWAGTATASNQNALKTSLAKGTDITGFNDLSAAQVNTEVDTGLADIQLDHLIQVADPGGVVANNSFWAKLHSKSATAVYTSYDNTTDSHEALRDRGDAAWITGAGSDPWATALPGAYGAGTAGNVVGNNLNATVSSRATPAQVQTELGTYGALKPTVAARTLDVSAGGEAGIDWANIGTPGSTQALSATTIGTVTNLTNDPPGVTTLLSRITSTLFTGITSLAQWLGMIAGKQAGNSTARTEMRATGAGSGAYDETTDSQEAIRDRGDASWITGTPSDPWATALPGAYGAGTAGKIVGDNINATVASRAVPGDAMTLTAGERTSLAGAIWGVLTSSLTVASSIGKLLVDNINATVSSRSSHTAADVWASATRTLTSYGTLVADVATAVWGATTRTLTAFGFTVNTNANATETAIKTVTDKLDTALELDGAVYRYTVNALEQAPAGGSGGATAGEIADAVWDEALSGHLTAGSAGAALNGAGSAGDPWTTPIPGSYGAGTAGNILGNRVDVAVSSRATPAQVQSELGTYGALKPTVAARTLDVNANGEAGLDWANIGSPATTQNLSATTIATVGTLTNAPPDSAGITTLLARIPAALFNGITSLAQWLGMIAGKQVGNATARTELRATGAGSGSFDEATDSQEAIRDRGDAAWITGTASDPWSTVLPGSYGAGTAGKIVGDNLNATVSSRATQTSVDTIGTNVTTLLGRITSTLFSGITSLAQWLGMIAGKQTGNATARTEMRATGAGSGTYDETTDSQEAIRDRGDSAWITGSAGDPWATLLPGAYGAGSAGKIVGDNLNATVSSRATQASVDAIAAKTVNLPSDPADASQINDSFMVVNNKLDAIEGALPANPASVGDIPTAIENADALLKRDMSAVTGEASRSPLNALRLLRNKWSAVEVANTLVVKKEDDVTTAWQAPLTTDSNAAPITSMDPV